MINRQCQSLTFQMREGKICAFCLPVEINSEFHWKLMKLSSWKRIFLLNSKAFIFLNIRFFAEWRGVFDKFELKIEFCLETWEKNMGCTLECTYASDLSKEKFYQNFSYDAIKCIFECFEQFGRLDSIKNYAQLYWIWIYFRLIGKLPEHQNWFG